MHRLCLVLGRGIPGGRRTDRDGRPESRTCPHVDRHPGPGPVVEGVLRREDDRLQPGPEPVHLRQRVDHPRRPTRRAQPGPGDPAPSITHDVGDIPAGGSVSTDWVLRGDDEGFYGVSATYTRDARSGRFALDIPDLDGAGAIHVWGGSALHMFVEADGTATKGEPYRVRIGLKNVSDVPIYNAGVELFTKGSSGYIYQPDQQLGYGTAVIEPGTTFWTPYYRLIPRSRAAPLNVANSFVAQTGGNVDVASTIESPATRRPIRLTATPRRRRPASAGLPRGVGHHRLRGLLHPEPGHPVRFDSRGHRAGQHELGRDPPRVRRASTPSAPKRPVVSPTTTPRPWRRPSTPTPPSPSHPRRARLVGHGDGVGLCFGPGKVALYLDATTGKALSSVKVSASGTFSKSLKIPALTGGTHLIIAVGADGSTATAALNVAAGVILKPTSAKPGGSDKATLVGFGAGEWVTFDWGSPSGATVGSTTAGTSGTGTATLTVPNGAAKGTYTVYAEGSDGTTATASLKVK